FTNVLEQKGLLLAVKPEEEQVIRALCGEAHHMRMSRGVIAKGELTVTEGPLRGRESMIRRVDRHKRIAILNVHISRVLSDICAGLEVTEKR
ncbi:MAG: hypothetical protein RR875_08985, partial [Clostridium sp.]